METAPSPRHLHRRSKWNDEFLRVRQPTLVRVESEELSRLKLKGGGNMEDVKTTMALKEGMRSRQTLGLIHDAREIADADLDSSRGAICLKMGPQTSRFARAKEAPEFCKAKCVGQLVLVQRRQY